MYIFSLSLFHLMWILSRLLILFLCSFDLFFRKNPFGGEYTVFAGLDECIRFIAHFKFSEEEILFLQSVMPSCEVW